MNETGKIEESTFTIESETRHLALGVAVVPGGNHVYANFTLSIQQRSIAIEGVVLNGNQAGWPVGLTIRRWDPEKANVKRFADGATISDMGFSAITYALEPTSDDGRRYRVPSKGKLEIEQADPNWFMLFCMWYLRAECEQRVTVHVGNYGEVDVKMSGVLLYRNIAKP
jgi:hypothetical protein